MARVISHIEHGLDSVGRQRPGLMTSVLPRYAIFAVPPTLTSVAANTLRQVPGVVRRVQWAPPSVVR